MVLVPLCRVQPDEGALTETERALARGAKAIKLHPQAELFTLAPPAQILFASDAL